MFKAASCGTPQICVTLSRGPSGNRNPLAPGHERFAKRRNIDKPIFFTSDRDGFLCIWAQRIGPDMHPAGPPFAVYHCHQRRHSLANIGGEVFQMDVGPNMIVFNRGDLTGEIWLLDPQ